MYDLGNLWTDKQYYAAAIPKIKEINHSLRLEETDDPTAIFVAAKVFCAQMKRPPKGAGRNYVFELFRDLIEEEMKNED